MFRTSKFNRFQNNWYSYAIHLNYEKLLKNSCFSFAKSSPLWVNLTAIILFRQPSLRWQKCVQRNSFNANGFNYRSKYPFSTGFTVCAITMMLSFFFQLKCAFCTIPYNFGYERQHRHRNKNRNSFMDRYSSHRKNVQNKHDMIELGAKKTYNDKCKRKISRKKSKPIFVPFATDRVSVRSVRHHESAVYIFVCFFFLLLHLHWLAVAFLLSPSSFRICFRWFRCVPTSFAN